MSELRRGDRIRLRAVVVLLVLIPGLVLFMVWRSWLGGASIPGGSIDGTAVTVLCCLIAINVLLKRWRPSWRLSPGELITIYVAVGIIAAITSGVWNWGGGLAPSIAYPIWFASPANQWADTLWPNLPPGMTVASRDVLQGFFLGNSSPYRWDIVLAWVRPALWWTAWVTATLWVTLCLSTLARRRWADEEKLPFPMTILPLQLTEPGGEIFRTRVFWVGIGISTGIGLLAVLNSLAPSVPQVPTWLDISALMSNNWPWDGMRTTQLAFGPWEIGLCYLMPVDLTFSLIVFNLFWRAEYVCSRTQGWLISPWSGFPYGDQQVTGAYLALMASILWLDRRYLAQAARTAIGLRSKLNDTAEAFSYRTAVFGAVGGLAFLWWLLARSGMGSAIAVSFLALFFVMVMVIVRLRAQLGPPSHDMYGTMPEFVLTQFPGTHAIAPGGLGMIAMLRPFMYEQDSQPAPAQLEALVMAGRVNANPTRMTWILLAVVPMMMLCYFWASLHVGYHVGMASKARPDVIAMAEQASAKLNDWLRNPSGPSWSGVDAIGIGFAAVLLLMYARLRLPFWPLHPLAFPLAFSWAIDEMLPAVALTWVFKVLLLRYGGLRAHRRALPFFLGLLVGTAITALLNVFLVIMQRW